MSNYYGNNDHYGSGGQGGDRGNYGGRYGNNNNYNNYNNYNRGNPYGQGRDRYNRGDNSNRMQWPRNSIKQEPQESPFPAHPSVKHDDEWKKREQNLQMLLQCSDQEKKYKEYMELSEEDKRRVFLPGQIGGNDLPIAKHLPSNWDDTVEYAVKQTKERMAKQGWIHNGNGGNNNEGQCYDSDNYSEDSADADYREAGNAKNKSVSGAEIFLKGLTYCPPMTNGFHIILANSDWCCCPCDDRMKNTWMEFAGVKDWIFEEDREKFQDPKVCKQKKLCNGPFEFLKHIEKLKDSCQAHAIIWWYLNFLFENYHAKGIRHIGFEEIKTKEYKKAQETINLEIRQVINKLHEENEEARKTLIEHEKTQKQLEEFKKSNKDLLSEMETMKSLHQKVGSTEEREEDVSVKVVEQCKRQSLKFCASYRRIFNKKSTIKLEVSQHFKLSEVMAKLYKANTFSFLFKSCPREVHKILQKLEIIFKVDQNWARPTKKIKKEINQEFQAKDAGGPTREFFQQVWMQLGDLTIGEIKLFELTNGGLLPCNDEILNYKARKKEAGAMEQVKDYYRAFGRLVAYCLLLSPENDGPLEVALNVLPALYQTAFLRDIFPNDEEYPVGVLVNHTYPLYNLEEKKKIWGRLKLNDEDDKEEQDGTNVEQNGIRLRQTVHEQFFDDRVLFCDSFKDGLTFGGAIDWSICFALFPTKVIQKVFFAGSHIVIEDILTKNNKFRFIVFKKQETIPAKQQEIDQLMIMFKETHELFEERLAALFRVRAEKDSGFLTKFVWLCTGSRFIPNIDAHPDYKITIEYNHTDKEMDTGSLPVMHTCAKLMKIPMYAYNADIEEFEMKVNQTAEYVEKFWFDQA